MILAGPLWVVCLAGVPTSRPAVFAPVQPPHVVLKGYVGNRVDCNWRGILLHKDENALLEPFRKRGSRDQEWAGEHAGKWLSAASLAYSYSHDEALLAKIKRVAQGLIVTQLSDGYLGTYADKDRWTSWDVWVHKYNLLGLEDYYAISGDQTALHACRRVGDLMAATFGPDRKDILKAGEHKGMASCSILEPMARLFRLTGDPRYFKFAEYIVGALENEDGPRIVSTLLGEKTVRKVADAKGYEMISCLVGLLEMYRQTGDERSLSAAQIAADDIINNLAYVTGGTTYGEVFCAPGRLPNAGHVAEECVTMSQVQLYRELLELTGEPCYGDALEHLLYNHLLASQHPSGESICYYNPLWGHKFYMNFLGCCISSGPRAMAMVPSLYYLMVRDNVVVNLVGASELDDKLPDGQRIRIRQTTDYPFSGKVRIDCDAQGSGAVLKIRVPQVAGNVRIEGTPAGSLAKAGSFLGLPFRGKITFDLDLDLHWRIDKGTGANDGLFALQYGPVVFAFDLDLNGKSAKPDQYAFDMDLAKLAPSLARENNRWVAQVNGFVRRDGQGWAPQKIKLLPYADAGLTGYFSVWLKDRTREDVGPFSLFTQDHEHCSRAGKNCGSIVDNSPTTFTSTDNGEKRNEDWFEVDSGWYSRFNVIVFRHGKSLPNGGWFDASKGKPRVLLKTWGDYHQVATIEDYPNTTAENAGNLKDGQAFRIVIPKDKREAAFRVRIVGPPAHGNDPKQNFASCSEIQVFYDPDL